MAINKTETVEEILDSGDNWIEFKTDKINKQRAYGDNRAFIHVGETLTFIKEKNDRGYWNIIGVKKPTEETVKAEASRDDTITYLACLKAVANLRQGLDSKTYSIPYYLSEVEVVYERATGGIKKVTEEKK